MNERTTTRSDYAERLERVFMWLADHLDDTLDLTRLADVACLSPYHFHRVYRAMQGETAADTVRRLRLHRAAAELITGETTIRTEPAVRLAALRHNGDYRAIGSMFERLMMFAVSQQLLGTDLRSFGGYYDDPSATPVNALRADACVAVPEGAAPYAELERVYRWLYGTWLAQSGEEPADAPTIEAYLNDACAVPPTALRTEIWLPLR